MLKYVFPILLLLNSGFLLAENNNQKDSCNFYGSQFRCDSNLCNGLVSKSFIWLTEKCIVKNVTTAKEVDEIFGNGGIIKKSIYPAASFDLNLKDDTNPWFDYCWRYGIFFFCDDFVPIKIVPGTWGIIFFKDDVVVGYSRQSIG
jgi:hypothetical protein